MYAAAMLAAAMAATEAWESHPFPHYPNGFSYSLHIRKNNEPSPSVVTTYSWDLSAGRSLYTVNNSAAGQVFFDLQLRRCDTGMSWDAQGNQNQDPSQFKCTEGTLPCPVSPFWVYPAPGSYQWNGTDTIDVDGVPLQCDRFDITSPMGRQTFWGTATQPCRTITNSGTLTQSEYVGWVPKPAPESAFEPPRWLAKLSCKHSDSVEDALASPRSWLQ